MFTGIIEEIGTINKITRGAKSAVLSIYGKQIFDDLNLGDSVAVNGVCLTVTGINKNTFMADVMHETMERSSLGSLYSGSYVNLERAMAANGRFGGHMVSGHIDDTGKIVKIKEDDNAIWYTIKAGRQIMRYVIEKGSIAMDGISLTVAKVSKDSFCVSVIPHTAKNTTLSKKKVGDILNLENDLVGKYIEKFMEVKSDKKMEGNITKEFLTRYGY
jgi:riboflavin synthase